MSLEIKDFDILGITPQIYIDSCKRKKSRLGGFASILSVILIIFGFIYFFLEIILRNSYTLISNQIYGLDPILNLTNLPLAIGIFDSYANFIDNIDNTRDEEDFSNNHNTHVNNSIICRGDICMKNINTGFNMNFIVTKRRQKRINLIQCYY